MVKDEMKKILAKEGKKQIISIGELTLDDFLKDGFIKDIPIVGNLFSAIKIGKTIKEYHFSKKLIRFITNFNKNSLDNEEYTKFKDKMARDDGYASKVTEVIFISIERFDKETKAEVYSRLFNCYIQNIYSWDDFIYHTTAIEQMYISDFIILKKLISINDKISIDDIQIKNFKSDKIRGSVERLRSMGFLTIISTTIGAMEDYNKSLVTLSSMGAKFYNNCITGIDFLN